MRVLRRPVQPAGASTLAAHSQIAQLAVHGAVNPGDIGSNPILRARGGSGRSRMKQNDQLRKETVPAYGLGLPPPPTIGREGCGSNGCEG